ncbi:hypothetical protein FOA52_010287 [Chlamydomonas sp. UWO 241]|nr:hypothetical protein FOA52_010287 [Chlamydomonas sp. UWO 241]
MDLAIVNSFSRLGYGSFGTIFVSEGRGGVVVKQVQDPANAAVLDKEHRDLKQLYEVVSAGGSPSFFSLPRPHGFFQDYWTFAREADLPRTFDIGLPPHAMYVMQRIWPVPATLTERIRDQFFPDRAKQLPFRPFLARLYLGKPQLRPTNPFFNSENFLLDAARIEQLQLPAGSIAAGMGQMLARINFRAGRDGRDIEFVLCGDPLNPLSQHPAYSCIDFNQMRPHNDNAGVIADSMASNDPYYPRSDSPHWNAFAAAYAAEAAGAGQAHLALQVLSLWHQNSYFNDMGSNMEGNWQLLQHAGAEKPIVASGTSGFKRTFLLHGMADKALLADATSADEVLLKQSSGEFTGMKLMHYEEAAQQAELLKQAPPHPDWRLEETCALRRAIDLQEEVYYPSRLVASPGLVAGSSRRIIEHTCSTFPGMSGGAGVDVQTPWQLLFVHTRADSDFRRNNYGYSVHHPLFVKAYEREVLPRLLGTPPELLSSEMLRCLHGYLTANKDQLADEGVVHQVEERCKVGSGVY